MLCGEIASLGTSAAVTVTVAAAQKLSAGVPGLLSVTCTEYEAFALSIGVGYACAVSPASLSAAAHVVPENHWYAYGEVPPDGVTWRTTDSPATNDGEAGDIVADRAGLTENWEVGEVAVTGVGALSVTWEQ
jgi:hypothetical protein